MTTLNNKNLGKEFENQNTGEKAKLIEIHESPVYVLQKGNGEKIIDNINCLQDWEVVEK